MAGWSSVLKALNDYRKSSYGLPTDKSLISPIARVILQKRRLINIQEIHNLFLEVSHEFNETILQSDEEREFLASFKVAFSKLPWNQLSVSEAQSFAGLLVDSLQRCQADNQLINYYVKMAVAEVQGPDFQERIVALRTALILLRAIFVSFPKSACTWANEILKAILNNFKVPQKNSNDFDIVLEALRCLQVLLRLPDKFIDLKEKEKVLVVVSKYLKANSPFIAIEAAKVYEAYYGNAQVISRVDVKNLLELLNGGVSLRLNQYKCSPKLLEYCFELKSVDKSVLDVPTLKLNIERIRKFPYIDAGMFADAFANVLERFKKDSDEDFQNIIMCLASANPKTAVSSSCFSQIIEKYIERCENYSDAVNLIRFLFDNLKLFSNQYANDLIGLLNRFHEKFPDSLKESDFSSFSPLTILGLQERSVDLILKVLINQPMLLASQMTLIFAQLKGDFLRLKHGESNVNKDAVIGLLRLFGSILRVSVENYSNYCDKDLVQKIHNWLLSQFTDESDWLKKEIEIVNGLLLAATSFASEKVVVTILSSLDVESIRQPEYPESLLYFLLLCISKDSGLFKLFLGSVEKYIHDLNVKNILLPQSIRLVQMFPIMKLYVENKTEISLGMMSFITKLICFTEIFENYQVVEVYSKMFWRSSESMREYCMTLLSSSLKNKIAFIPHQILQCVRGILESSEIPPNGTGLIEKVQEIIRHFLLDESFKVRLECGIVMGLMVKLFNDNDKEGINDLFTQFMKHAMKAPVACKSRVCYIMGLTSLKAHLDQNNVKFIDLTGNALVGLFASWNREVDNENKQLCREIVACSIEALTFYLEKCGFLMNSEFYRDTCELLLEQVFWRDKCELTMASVLRLARCLGLYANLMPCQSEFIKKTVRLLAESSYLSRYRTLNIDLLVDISEYNPAILKPSELIYKLVRRNVSAYKKGVFGKICQYFNLQVSFDDGVAFELIDNGLFLFLLERTSLIEGLDSEAEAAISFLIQKVMAITLLERFDFWLENVFENLSLTERTRSNSNFNRNKDLTKISLSDSAFSLTDLVDTIDVENFHPTQSTVHLIVSSLAGNIGKEELLSFDQNIQKRFLNCLIKICFNISAEKSQERKFYLSGISLFRGIVKTFSRPLVAGDISILEPFDSQIVSIISSILRASEEGDPLYAACAFATLFSLCTNRPDLQNDLKQETGRVYNLVNRSITILKEQEIYWREEIVENLILLSIIVGLCSLMKSGFDLSRFDSEICGILKSKIQECFDAYKDGQLEKNLRASLSGSDRLLLVEIWTKLNDEVTEIDGVLSLLNGLNSESMESVCVFSTEIFKKANLCEGEELRRLLNQIVQFGLDKRDPMAIDCIVELKMETKSKLDYLRKFSKEFLSKRFSDFDTEFGLKTAKAEESFITKDADAKDQEILFDILTKLVSCCLNDLEVNFSKDILKTLKAIFTNPQISRNCCNSLLVEWIALLEEIDSVFLNQLVFFSISSNPQLWDAEGTLKELKKHFMKLLSNVNTLEMALDSWILLLKSQSKRPENEANDSFDTLVEEIADQIETSFQKHRGSSIDPVWERIFGIAQTICNSSKREMTKVKELSMRSLEDLNDFK